MPLLAGLALAAPVVADVKQDVYEDDEETEVIYDEVGEHPEDGIGDMESLDTSELAAFEQGGDDIAEDVYGEFDPDLNWTTDDDDWERWYEHSPEEWSEQGEERR